MMTYIPPGPPKEPYVRYRAMSVAAVVSLVFGLLSPLTAVHWAVALIPAVGLVAATKALRQIRHAPQEFTGAGVARAGMTLCGVFWVLGYGWLMFARASEVPWGYQRVTYEMLQPDPDVAGEQIPQTAYDLEEKKVFVEGYIAPGRQQSGLRRFILCPAIASCQFCTPNPKPTEMVLVTLEGDMTFDYTIYPVQVGGIFHVDPLARENIPYKLDADYVR